MLAVLANSDAPLIWHKHSAFYDHLREVWAMLCNWEQPRATCRLGLFHSAYSNSFVSMNCFDPATDRRRVADLIGEEAETLVYKFCSIDRQQLEATVLRERSVRRDGYAMAHIHSGEPLAVSGAEAAAMVTETLADEADQRFGWQSDLEAGSTMAAWPGVFMPTLRLGRTSQLASALRASGLVEEANLPPIFARCSAVLTTDDEVKARQHYWQAITVEAMSPASAATHERTLLDQIANCEMAAASNPHIAEPHVVNCAN